MPLLNSGPFKKEAFIFITTQLSYFLSCFDLHTLLVGGVLPLVSSYQHFMLDSFQNKNATFSRSMSCLGQKLSFLKQKVKELYNQVLITMYLFLLVYFLVLLLLFVKEGKWNHKYFLQCFTLLLLYSINVRWVWVAATEPAV